MEIKISSSVKNPKEWYSMPQENICYEITRVRSNRYYGEYHEYFSLRMWGDRRIKRLQVQTDAKPKGELLDEQPIYQAYFGSFSMAKQTALKAIEILADDSKYRNMYIFRESLNIETWTDIYQNDCIIHKKRNNISINNNIVSCPRDIIKAYLNANLKGTGYVYTERQGANGDIAIAKDRYVVVDIEPEEVVFTIKTPFSKKEFKMPNISIKEDKALEEYILGCEFIVSSIWSAKFTKKVINRESIRI